MLARLTEWLRKLRRPPTADELEARKESERIFETRDTVRTRVWGRRR
jgi:hypothetical protein